MWRGGAEIKVRRQGGGEADPRVASALHVQLWEIIMISVIELLYSVLFLPDSQDRDSATLRKGKKDCSVKLNSPAEQAAFG